MGGGGLVLYGAASKEIASHGSAASDSKQWQTVSDFLGGGIGDARDLWHLASGILGQKNVPAPRLPFAVPAKKLLELKDEQALLLESHRLGLSSKARRQGSPLKKNEALQIAVIINIKSGRVETACRLLIELGQNALALALAPGAGLEFWRTLMCEEKSRGAPGHPAVEQGGDFVLEAQLFELISGEIMSTINVLVSRGDYQSASLVASALSEGRFRSSSSSAPSEGENAFQVVSSKMAQLLMERALPLQAAAVMLAAGCIREAFTLLIRGDELVVAFGLAQCFQETQPQVQQLLEELLGTLAERASCAHAPHLSLQLMEGASADARGLHAARLAAHPSSVPERSDKDEDRQAAHYDDAVACSATGDLSKAARGFILAQKPSEAVAVLTRRGGVLERTFKEWPRWAEPDADVPPQLYEAAALLHAVEAEALEDAGLLREIVGWAAWVGGCLAAHQQQPSPGVNCSGVAAQLFHACLEVKQDPLRPCAAVDEHRLRYAIALALLRDPTPRGTVARALKARALLQELAQSEAEVAEEAKAALQALDEASARREASRSSPDAQQVVDVARTAVDVSGPPAPTGSRLPAEARDDALPLLDGTADEPTGAFVVLEDGRTTMPRSTAIMWAHVNPFSPLGTGKRLAL